MAANCSVIRLVSPRKAAHQLSVWLSEARNLHQSEQQRPLGEGEKRPIWWRGQPAQYAQTAANLWQNNKYRINPVRLL